MGLVSKVLQLSELSPKAIDWFSGKIEVFSIKKNELLLASGKTCNYLYYIKTGIAGGYYTLEHKEVCNWIAAEGDFATSYYSFISRKPSHETIECFEDCLIEAISYAKINELYTLFPESERAGRLILEDYYSRLEERLISLQFISAKERYNLLHSKRPEIIKRAPLGRIASYLGMQQETLSRIRASK